MKNQGKRISILSLAEAREFYSIPKFTPQEREYFFTFTDEILDYARKGQK